MNKKIGWILAALLSLCWAGSTFAEGDDPSRSCREDMSRLCGDVPPGGGRIKQCMKKHQADLSDACKEAMAAKLRNEETSQENSAPGENAATTGNDDPQDPCGDDLGKFCKNVQPGGGRILRCLQEHQTDISDDCKQALASKNRHEGPRDVCRDDVGKFCKDVEPGEGRIVRCLKNHVSELSDGCSQMMKAKGDDAGAQESGKNSDDASDDSGDDSGGDGN